MEQARHIAAPEQRAAFLRAACGEDVQVCQRLEATLRAEEQTAETSDAGAVVSDDATASPSGRLSAAVTPGARIGHYQVVRPQGAGGMGEVYLAQDTRLGRLVALKFLPEEAARDPARRARFFSEARAAAVLDHPNICTVYDVAETDDALPFITMEWLDGPTLREHMAGAPLPLEELVQIGLQVAEALVAAHAHGIVHRDLKPANVSLMAGGLVKVLDFGLAKWESLPPPEEASTPLPPATGDQIVEPGATTTSQTVAGQVVGSPGYMSPEQATGQPVDHRTDLFSLGVILYEMAIGRPPFAAGSRAKVLRRTLEGAPEPLTRLNERAPLELERIVLKCLQKAPRDRYQSAEELRADLRRLQAGNSVRRQRWERVVKWSRQVLPGTTLALALAVATVALWPRSGPRANVVPETSHRVFVLPFRSPPGDRVSEELGGRITDALIDSLGVLLGPDQVGPRKSGWLRKPEDEARRLAFAEQNACNILDGRVALVSNRLQVTLSSYSNPSNPPVWTETHAATTNDVIALDWELLESLMRRLGSVIPDPCRPGISQILSNNLEALEWCRRGWELQQSFSVPRLALAKEAFLRATEVDPNYAEAHYGALWVYRVSYERPYRDAYPDLRSRARTILQIDDTHWKARYRLAWARILYDYDWERGMPELEAVLREGETDPGEWSIYYRIIGRLGEARLFQEKQDALEPRSGPLLWHSVAGKYIDGRYQEVVAGGKEIQRVDPEAYPGFLFEASGHIGLGEFPAAIEAIHRGLDLHERQDLRGLLGFVYARMGARDEAATVLRELGQLPYAQPYWVARIHAALGNTEEALRWLEKAYEDRSELLLHADIGLGGLRLDGAWDGLRSEPRFHELLRKTGLDKWPR